MQHYKLMMQVLTKRHSGHIESFKKALKTHSENVQQRQKRVGERCEKKRSFFLLEHISSVSFSTFIDCGAGLVQSAPLLAVFTVHL